MAYALTRMSKKLTLLPARQNRRRRNPDDELPPGPKGMAEATWRESLKDSGKVLSRMLVAISRQLAQVGVRPEDLPSRPNVDEFAEAKLIFAASSHPSMTAESRYAEHEDDVAAEMFRSTLVNVSFYDDPAVQEILAAFHDQLAHDLCIRRAPARAHFASITGVEDDRDCRVRTRAAPRRPVARPAPVKVEDEFEGMSGDELIKALAEERARAFAGEDGEEDEEEVIEERPAPKTKPARPAPPVVEREVKEKTAGQSPYLQHTLKRRLPIAPPAAMLALARKDVLLFRVPDGRNTVTQVYCKGAITHTFTHSRGRDSETIAAAWANEWRKDDPKKRGMSRILFSAPGLDDFSVVADSLDDIAASKTRKAKSHEATIEDLKRMKLQNPRHNPDWQELFGIAKTKGAEGAAAAKLAARRAAHDGRALALRARIAAERQRVRSAYSVLGPSLMEVSHGNRKEFDALDDVMGGKVQITGSGYDAQRRHREGFFAMEDELKTLARTRPNPFGWFDRTPAMFTVTAFSEGGDTKSATANSLEDLVDALDDVGVKERAWDYLVAAASTEPFVVGGPGDFKTTKANWGWNRVEIRRTRPNTGGRR